MQALIFDFGNVVGFFDHYRTLNRLAPHTKVPLDELYLRLCKGELEDAFERGAITMAEFLRRVRRIGALGCDNRFLIEAIADIFWPNPEVCELIPVLQKRYRLLLGSNTNLIHSVHFRRQFAEVLAHFDGLVLSHEVRARKPEAEFFQHCQRLAQTPVEQCLFIDDLEDNVKGARRTGMGGLVYRPNDDFVGRLREFGVAF